MELVKMHFYGVKFYSVISPSHLFFPTDLSSSAEISLHYVLIQLQTTLFLSRVSWCSTISSVCIVWSVDEVTSLRQQLRTSQRALKKSEKMNKQMLRQVQKLEERLESMMKLQKMMADRQLAELNDGGNTAALVKSTQRDVSSASHQSADTEQSTFYGIFWPPAKRRGI